jgi:hypothetical protein
MGSRSKADKPNQSDQHVNNRFFRFLHRRQEKNTQAQSPQSPSTKSQPAPTQTAKNPVASEKTKAGREEFNKIAEATANAPVTNRDVTAIIPAEHSGAVKDGHELYNKITYDPLTSQISPSANDNVSRVSTEAMQPIEECIITKTESTAISQISGASARDSPKVSDAAKDGHNIATNSDNQIVTPLPPSIAEPIYEMKPPLRKSSISAAASGTSKESNKRLKEAIDKLNNAVIRLYKASALLRGDLKQEDLSKDLNLPPLNVHTLDERISEAETITKQLIAEFKRAKEERKAQKGFLVAIEKFLKTTSYVVSPALKSFLKVAVQGSAVTSTLSELMQIPILNPYGLLCSSISLLIEVRSSEYAYLTQSCWKRTHLAKLHSNKS